MQPDTSWKNRIKNQSQGVVWLTAFVLAVLVVATVALVTSCLYSYAHRSDFAISLSEGQVNEQASLTKHAESQVETNPVLESHVTQYSGAQAVQQAKKNAFYVEDADQIWQTETEVAIFKASYENAEGAVTVQSADGSHVIAPGTANDYTFTLKNTGKTAANYKVWVETKASAELSALPLQARMSGHKGWLLGESDTWSQASALDGITDEEKLGAGKSAEYTIYWKWPFEQGNDELDTRLGNLAADQPLTYTIIIHTMAVECTSSGGGNDGGSHHNPLYAVLGSPKTGDTASPLLWLICLAAAAGGIVIVWARQKKRKEKAAGDHAKEDNRDGTSE